VQVVSWKSVGKFLTDNASTGVGLVGSLLVGNVPGAIAAGVALVSGATGTDNPEQALSILQSNPESMLKLKELQYKNEESIRGHIESMTRLKLEDEQASHQTTQETIRNGDNSDKWFVWFTRPGQSWVSLGAAIFYAFTANVVDTYVLGLLLTLPFTYAGLRQVGKGITAFTNKIGK
tara:strand:- start:23185 stop:23715 length:531 start_codon:yes stop_codon:yes gene_type:complete